MRIDKWTVMKILRGRGIVSFDEYNYIEMVVSLEIGWDTIKQKRIDDDLLIEFNGSSFIKIPYLEYLKKSRELKINHILGDI